MDGKLYKYPLVGHVSVVRIQNPYNSDGGDRRFKFWKEPRPLSFCGVARIHFYVPQAGTNSKESQVQSC